MPYTLAHPAVVLPLNLLPRKWRSLTGLIIGSLMPDFEAFIRWKSQKVYSHTWDGSVWFGIPGGIVLAFIFHNTVRDALIIHLPPVLQQRFTRYLYFDWNTYFIKNIPTVIISLSIGIVSHFFWDSFTHFNGFFATRVPALESTFSISGKSFEMPFLMQYINSVLGFAVIFYAIKQLPVDKFSGVKNDRFPFWTIAVSFLVAVIILRAIMSEIKSINDLSVIITSAGMVSIVLSATAFLFFKNLSGTSASRYNNN